MCTWSICFYFVGIKIFHVFCRVSLCRNINKIRTCNKQWGSNINIYNKHVKYGAKPKKIKQNFFEMTIEQSDYLISIFSPTLPSRSLPLGSVGTRVHIVWLLYMAIARQIVFVFWLNYHQSPGCRVGNNNNIAMVSICQSTWIKRATNAWICAGSFVNLTKNLSSMKPAFCSHFIRGFSLLVVVMLSIFCNCIVPKPENRMDKEKQLEITTSHRTMKKVTIGIRTTANLIAQLILKR